MSRRARAIASALIGTPYWSIRFSTSRIAAWRAAIDRGNVDPACTVTFGIWNVVDAR